MSHPANLLWVSTWKHLRSESQLCHPRPYLVVRVHCLWIKQHKWETSSWSRTCTLGLGPEQKGLPSSVVLVTDMVKKKTTTKKQRQWINFIKNAHIHAECGDLLTPAQGQIIQGCVSSSWAGPDWSTHLKKTWCLRCLWP